jgi:hypothetical protein
MRLLSRLGTALFALASLTGCGLILGTFTTDGNVGKDGGSDATSTDATEADGNTDAAPPPKVLGCVIDGVPHKIGYGGPDPEDQPLVIHAQQGNDRRIAFRAIVSSRRRVIIADVKSDGTGLNPILLANVPATADVIGMGNFEGGLGFLHYDPPTNSIGGTVLLDVAGAPTATVTIPTVDAVPPNPSAFASAIVPLDIANGVFFVAVGWSVVPGTTEVYAGAARLFGGGPPLPPLPKLTSIAKVNFESDDVMLDHAGSKATIILNSDQGLGQAQVMELSFGPSPTKPTIRNLNGVNGGKVIFGTAAPSVATPGINLALFLSGDLNSQSVPFGFVTSSIDDGKIGGIDLATMPPQVKFDKVEDLPADKANVEFRFFPQVGPQSLIVGRYTGTGAGINLLWFDGKGYLRGRASGESALVPNLSIAGAAATFRSPPTAIFAGLSVLWKNTAKELFLADVTCK